MKAWRRCVELLAFCGCCEFHIVIMVVDISSAGEMPRDAGISRRPKRGGFEEEPGCGFPHSSDPEKMVKGAVGRGHPEWVEPCDMDPDEEGSRGL